MPMRVSFFASLLLASFHSSTGHAGEFQAAYPHLIFEGIRNASDSAHVEAGVKLKTDPATPMEAVYTSGINSYVTITRSQLEFEKRLAAPVFVATTGTGTNHGTAFLIGKNLVLTNNHVVASTNECLKFSVDLTHKKEKVTCQKVEYCGPGYDFCVVRMNKMANGLEIGDEVNPLRMTMEPPAPDAMLFSVGSPVISELQAASAVGSEMFQEPAEWLLHCIHIFGGSSGAPIFNTNGEVVGLHQSRLNHPKQHLKCDADRTTGRAIPIWAILFFIKRDRPQLYDDLAQFAAMDVYRTWLKEEPVTRKLPH